MLVQPEHGAWYVVVAALTAIATAAAFGPLIAVAAAATALTITAATLIWQTVSTSHEVWAFGASTLEQPLILFDCACTSHLFGDESLLSNITNTFPRMVRGANGMSTSHTKGTFELIKSVVTILKGAPNLLSQSKMRPDYKISLVDDAQFYVLHKKKGEQTLVFALYKDVYPLVCVIGEDGETVYEHKVVTAAIGGLKKILEVAGGDPRMSAFVTRQEARSRIRTEEAKRAGQSIGVAEKGKPFLDDTPYTRAESLRALEARELERTFLGSAKAAKMLLAGGHLIGTNITPADVDRAQKIWGKNIDNLMTNPYKADKIPRVAKEGRTVPRGTIQQRLYADILFLWGHPQLLIKSLPLGITVSSPIDDKSEASLSKGLCAGDDKFKASGFTSDEIHVDGEKGAASSGCVSKMASRGKRLVKATRDDHVVIIERENASTRRRLIQLLLGLMFRCPPSWLGHAATYVLDMKGFLHRPGDRASDDTPAEQFYGRRFHQKEFWIKFGDYVLSKIPETAKTDKGYHRDECIFLRRDWSGDDSAVLYSFKSDRFVNRKFSELTLMSMQEHVVETVNEMCDRETAKDGMNAKSYDFSKIDTDDQMSVDDRIKNIMSENIMAVYNSRRYLRSLVGDDDEGEEGERRPNDDDDGDDHVEHPNDADSYAGPFADDTLELKARRAFLVRKKKETIPARRGRPPKGKPDAEDEVEPPATPARRGRPPKKKPDDEAAPAVTPARRGRPPNYKPESFVSGAPHPEVSRPESDDSISAGSAFVDPHQQEHDLGGDLSRHLVACGVFDWGDTDDPVACIDDDNLGDMYADEDEDERTKTRRRFNALKAFYATSRKRDDDMVRAFNLSIKDAFRAYPSETYASTFAEVQTVLKRTFRAVDSRRLTKLQRKRAVPCMLFLKAKVHPHTGDFLKLKARLVACQSKNRQDPSQITHPSSPTVSQTALYAMLTVATSKGYVIGTADVPSAYLFAKTNPKNEKVHAFFDRATTKVALEVNPELQALVDDSGRLWGALDYSLYGLVESGAMWFLHVSATLTSMGFTASESDPCLWTGKHKGEEIMLALYVDDFAAAARTKAILRDFFKELDKTYPGVAKSLCDDGVVTYLGCSIDASEKGVTYIHQPEFVRMLLKDFDEGPHGPIKPRSSPAPLDLLTIDDESPPLSNEGEKYFRSMLMRIAFLVNMTRFDLKVPLMFLSRRMHCATEQDMKRLKHLVGYIYKTAEYGITIKPGDGELHVFAYTDASHATMYDMRSITGGAIIIGRAATVFAKSSKQSIVAKSSMECEYIACSDVASQVIHVRNLLISLGIPQPPATIFVDNNSAIHVIKNGRTKAMLTRHIRVREAWVSERCDNDELMIVHCPTTHQVADVLTKPLAGVLLTRMTQWLLGWVPHPGPTMATGATKTDE